MSVNPNNILVALDDGHGMSTKGKSTPTLPSGIKSETGSIMHENEFNRAVVALIDKELRRCGFRTILVAPTDDDTPLPQRTKTANNAKANLYLSVHANAIKGEWGSWGGIETYVNPKSESAKIGAVIHKYLMQGTKLRDRGVHDGNWLYVVKKTAMPCVLVECGFMDNLDEAKLLLSKAYRKECATELAKALCEYYGVPYKGEIILPPAPKYQLVIAKQRVFEINGKLIDRTGNYNLKGTDVRWFKISPENIKKADFIYKNGAKVSQIVKETGADFGINLPYFHNGLPLGDTEDNDKVISSAYGKMLNWHEFAFVDGKPIIGQLNRTDKQDFLVQGAPLLLEDGKLVYEQYRVSEQVNDDIGKSSAQRTFIGIDSNGVLVFGVADGRTKYDKGLTLKEMALFMQSKGAKVALNGDGGSSTVLAIKGGSVVSQNKGIKEPVTNHALVFFLQ